MKIFTRTIFFFSILWLVGSPFALGQAKNKYSPYVKKELYKKGWIDFNKNGKMDPYENPNLDIELRIDDRFWQYKKIIMSFQHLNILQHTASLIGGRDNSARTDPQIAPHEMHFLLLEPFRVAFSKDHAHGTMSSYNDYAGVPISGSEQFLINLLR